MSAAKPGGPARPRTRGQQHELVQLVTRLVVAQAVAAAAVGLPFSRRQLSSVLITLALTAALLALAALVRTGGHAAWLIAITAESAFVVFGISCFLTTRYLGGTLLGIVALGTLLQPAVSRAFSAGRRGGLPARGDYGPAPDRLDDAADGPLGGSAIG